MCVLLRMEILVRVCEHSLSNKRECRRYIVVHARTDPVIDQRRLLKFNNAFIIKLARAWFILSAIWAGTFSSRSIDFAKSRWPIQGFSRQWYRQKTKNTVSSSRDGTVEKTTRTNFTVFGEEAFDLARSSQTVWHPLVSAVPVSDSLTIGHDQFSTKKKKK